MTKIPGPRATRVSTLTKRSTLPGPPSLSEPQLTHLDKIFWPSERYTKGDLIDYYRTIAPAIVPHLKGRPQSMNRQPNGIAQKGFFQKDLSGYYPRWIRTVRIHSAHANRTINFLLCEDERTLLYMANLGCIELNPWLSRAPTLDHPDFCVIDLDPSDKQPFSVVVTVAREVKRVLDAAKITAFCKTSGSSGLHIHLPLPKGCDYEFSRELALAVCEVVNRRLPALTSLARNPAARGGKLYLDCFQNSRGQTLAAPYCVRPRPGATVSTPLRWTEVKPGLDPRAFTIKTVPRRLAKLGDLWAPLTGAQLDRKTSARPKLAALRAALARVRKMTPPR